MPALVGEFYGFTADVDASGVATVTLNRPHRLNAVNVDVKRELTEWFVHAQVDESVRAVVVTGAGKAFCSGDDISGEPDTESHPPVFIQPLNLGQRVPIRVHGALRMGSQPLARMLRAFDKPTVAAINGYAIHAGLTIALACDFRFASRNARLGSGTLRFAFTPDDGGAYLLVHYLGLPKALDFVMRNRIVDAEEALTLGLVGEVVDPDSLMQKAHSLAAELATGPSVAMRLVKRALYGAAELTFEASLEDIASKSMVTDYHPDSAEGVAAFREHRPPRFNDWLGASD